MNPVLVFMLFAMAVATPFVINHYLPTQPVIQQQPIISVQTPSISSKFIPSNDVQWSSALNMTTDPHFIYAVWGSQDITVITPIAVKSDTAINANLTIFNYLNQIVTNNTCYHCPSNLIGIGQLNYTLLGQVNI